MDDRKYWIGFNLIKGIGAVRMRGLVAYFGGLESAWSAVLSSVTTPRGCRQMHQIFHREIE